MRTVAAPSKPHEVDTTARAFASCRRRPKWPTGLRRSPTIPLATHSSLKSWRDLRRELAQMVARRPSGEVRHWPVVETVQKNGVCAEVIAPAPKASTKLLEVAAQIGDAIVSGLG